MESELEIQDLQTWLSKHTRMSHHEAGDFIDEFTTMERLQWIEVLKVTYRLGRESVRESAQVFAERLGGRAASHGLLHPDADGPAPA